MEHLDKKLELWESVLSYLDHSHNLTEIQRTCDKYKKLKNCLVHTFTLFVDPAKLIEINVQLGNLLLKKPVNACLLFQEVVYHTIQTLQLLPGVSLSQISVVLRLMSLPALNDVYHVQSLSQLSKRKDRGLLEIKGIVIGFTAVSTYTRSTRYFCPNTECEGNEGNHFIRVHVPGSSEAETIRNDFKCSFCLTNLVEQKSCRNLSDKIVAEIVPDDSFIPRKYGEYCSRKQAITLYVRDDLVKEIELGECYRVFGIVRRDEELERITITVEANNLQKIKGLHGTKAILPVNILKIYEDRKSSPWSFALSLACIFGGRVCAVGTYVKLKLGILLSLVSQGDNKYRPLHVLAVGNDTEILFRLLEYGKTFSRRAVNFSSNADLCGKVTKDKYKNSPFFMEAGGLELARGGLCYLGDLSRLKKSIRDELTAVLGSSRILLDIEGKFTGGLPQKLDQPLMCQVWGYSDTIVPKKSQNGDEIFSGCDTGDIPKSLLNAFGIVHFTDVGSSSSCSEEVMMDMCHHILMSESASEISPSLPSSDEDFCQFIEYSSSLDPPMRTEAENLLQMYYLASRKSRSSGYNSSAVPVSALQTLMSLAYSHAKLNLKTEVTEEDALMAVILYEESLTARLGYSVLSVQPTPHFAATQLSNHVGKQNDRIMNQFHIQLLRFCGTQTGHEE
ncbi:hypothetical protein ScPMuIL_010924 [Solemya velum]